jgi:hypothetical protein
MTNIDSDTKYKRAMALTEALNGLLSSDHEGYLTEGLSVREVLIADLLHHSSVALFVLTEEKGGIDNISEEDIDSVVKIYRDMLTKELKKRMKNMKNMARV